jgi:hypothetical protein
LRIHAAGAVFRSRWPSHLLLQHVEECHLVLAHRLLLEECSDAQVHLLLQLLNLASSLGHLSLGNSLVLGGQVPEQQQQQVQQQQVQQQQM